MKQRHPHNIQTRLSPEHVAFLATLDAKPAEAISRAIELARLSVDASRTTDPAAQLAYHLDRAAAALAAMRSAHPPQTLAGSTATPTHDAPLYKEGAQARPPATELAGFEGWDE